MEAAVVSGILKIVSNKLAPLLIKEYSLIVGVQEHLLDLEDQVREINCWLEAVGDEVSPNTPTFNWLRKLKDIAYDVDDIVDEFQLKVEEHDAHGVAGVMSRYMCKKPKSLILQCKAASKLKAVKMRFDAIVKQRTEFNAIANSLLAGHPARDRSQTTAKQTTLPTVDVASVLGRDQEKHQIISKLVDDKHIIKTISIVGLGGSGKTTLAKLVFNDCSIIEKHFEVRLWVHVSQEFDVDKLIKKLFEAFADNNPGQHGLPYMCKTISDKLHGKRLLLVLDDVWTESLIQWEIFMAHLKSGAPGSRILLTTRSKRVAETVRSIDQFDLPFLSTDDSWTLFQHCLVIPAEGLELEFVKVGKEIVKKCGGVPLAIKVLAGVLQGKKQIQEWESMRDSNVLDVEGKERVVSACLRLSYLKLPSHLKQCFTICSLFPKGHKIDKEQLIDQWIAHDMITGADGVDYLEYIGYESFNSLVQMCFLQDVEKNYYGRVTCRMHDLIHDFARSIVKDEISLDLAKEATSSTKGYRYFSLTEQAGNLPSKRTFKKSRAIYVDKGDDTIFGHTLKNARHLRSITMKSVYAAAVPIAMFQVKKLKYLEISGLKCEALPEAISDIWSLQALHVTFSDIRNLPKSIGKLQKLRTLNLSNCIELRCLPDSIGDCQMISTIDVCYCDMLYVLPDSIGRIEKLRVLRLGTFSIKRLPSSITTLGNLECLDFLERCGLVELPECISNLKKLEVLNLGRDGLSAMPVDIGQLTRLQHLSLFVVGEGEKCARISELGNLGRISGNLTIMQVANVTDPGDAHRACLKQKTNLQSLELYWRKGHYAENVNTELEQAVLDGLEPPSGIKCLNINGYQGKQYARWMLKQVGDKEEGTAHFTCLTVMRLSCLSLNNLDGLVELPCLEELELRMMRDLESISGGPFPSLVKLRMETLLSLREVWMVTKRTLAGGEEVGGYSKYSPHEFGGIQIGTRLSIFTIWNCPELRVMPSLPSSLEYLELRRGNEQLLSLGQGSSLPSSLCHLKELELTELTAPPGSESGHGWELLRHMTALESFRICWPRFTNLPESVRSLTSLRRLIIDGNHFRKLPAWLGELRCLQYLTIEFCHRLTSLPKSMGDLCSLRRLEITGLPELTCLPQSICCFATSLQELSIRDCRKLRSLPQRMNGLISLVELIIDRCAEIKFLPKGIKDLTALKLLMIRDCPDLARRCEKGMGADWHLISHIPDLQIEPSLQEKYSASAREYYPRFRDWDI